MAALDNVFRVKDHCFLEYPNGEVWAKQGDFVQLDYRCKTPRTWMHGQESRIRNLTPEEREGPVEVVALSDKFLDKVPKSFRPPKDRMIRSRQMVTKEPEPEDEPEEDLFTEDEVVEK